MHKHSEKSSNKAEKKQWKESNIFTVELKEHYKLIRRPLRALHS